MSAISSTITIEHLPNELLCEILAFAGNGNAACVSKRWKACINNSSTTHKVISLINKFVEQHPERQNIIPFLSTYTNFHLSVIPKNNKKSYLQQLFRSLDHIIRKMPQKDKIHELDPHKNSFGLERFKESVAWIEYYGLRYLHSKLPNELYSQTYPFDADAAKNFESRLQTLKQWFRTTPKNSISEFNLFLSKAYIVHLPPDILHDLPLLSCHLSDSGHKVLPPYIAKVRNIKHLYLNRNPIASLPAEFRSLEQLLCIGIRGTQLNPGLEVFSYLKTKKLQLILS